jgi:enoyl-CoA hydratase/carnithine racemase
MRDELMDALALAAAEPTLEVVLRAAGASFCSGGDLDEFGTFPDPATAHLVRTTRSPARLLAGMAERVRAEVHGACIGAGIELAALARYVVATPDAFFQLPEVGMGLIPGAGGTASLPRRIGRQRTAYLALTGRRLDAATARAWGLIDAIAERA